jgi:hypothetical protein
VTTKSKTARRRCCVCRNWYLPEPPAAAMQLTCGKACRLLRRGVQQKKRREEAPAAVRALDRARKQKQRALEATGRGSGPPMSRAGLGAPGRAAIERIVEKLGQDQRMSRAGLRRQLTRLSLEEAARAAAAPGTSGGDVTGRPP